jgi:lipid-A-disaccharide synthase
MPRTQHILISTGEVSGDLLGARLIVALHQQAADRGIKLQISALGGDRMAQAGATLLGHTSSIGAVGLLESLPFILPSWQIQQRTRQYLRNTPPDLVVAIDYMGANLSLGAYLRRHFPKLPIAYYIAPQAWVWSINRRTTDRIVQMSDRLLAIFPEEARFFAQHGASVTWVGHPLVDVVRNIPSREQSRTELGIAPETIAIALLPASRRQELKSLLPPLFTAAQQLQAQISSAQFWIPLSLETYRQPIERAINRYGLRAKVVGERTNRVLAAADVAIGKSGTVNLELALLNVPQVVIYRVHPLTAWIARKLLGFKIPFMSPPNLLQMQPIVPELLQEDVTPDRIVRETMTLLFDPQRREQMLAGYQAIRQSAGEVGASDRAAREILDLLP